MRRARQQGGIYRQVAGFGHSPALVSFLENHPLEIGGGRLLAKLFLKVESLKSRMSWPIRNTRSSKPQEWAAFAQCSVFRYCVKASQLA